MAGTNRNRVLRNQQLAKICTIMVLVHRCPANPTAPQALPHAGPVEGQRGPAQPRYLQHQI